MWPVLNEQYRRSFFVVVFALDARRHRQPGSCRQPKSMECNCAVNWVTLPHRLPCACAVHTDELSIRRVHCSLCICRRLWYNIRSESISRCQFFYTHTAMVRRPVKAFTSHTKSPTNLGSTWTSLCHRQREKKSISSSSLLWYSEEIEGEGESLHSEIMSVWKSSFELDLQWQQKGQRNVITPHTHTRIMHEAYRSIVAHS